MDRDKMIEIEKFVNSLSTAENTKENVLGVQVWGDVVECYPKKLCVYYIVMLGSKGLLQPILTVSVGRQFGQKLVYRYDATLRDAKAHMAGRE